MDESKIAERAWRSLWGGAYARELRAVADLGEQHLRVALLEGASSREATHLAMPVILDELRQVFDEILSNGRLTHEERNALSLRQTKLLEVAYKTIIERAWRQVRSPVGRRTAKALLQRYRSWQAVLADSDMVERAGLLDRVADAVPEIRKRLVAISETLRVKDDPSNVEASMIALIPLVSEAFEAMLGYRVKDEKLAEAMGAWILLNAFEPANDAEWRRGPRMRR